MRHPRAKSYALAACLSLFLLGAVGAQTPDPRSRAVAATAPEISYTVSMRQPHTHLFDVEARLAYKSSTPAALELRIAVWTPGSYPGREFERDVQEFEVRQ